MNPRDLLNQIHFLEIEKTPTQKSYEDSYTRNSPYLCNIDFRTPTTVVYKTFSSSFWQFFLYLLYNIVYIERPLMSFFHRKAWTNNLSLPILDSVYFWVPRVELNR